jgi:hypothetical protein
MMSREGWLVPRQREYPRVNVGACDGVLRGSLPVVIVDVSRGGLKLETKSSVRPGTRCELKANLHGFRLLAQVEITRCIASGTVPDGKGGRSLLYLAGATIVTLEGATLGQFEEWLDGRLPELEGTIEQRRSRVN